MFMMRCVHGTNKGRYISGVSESGLEPTWCDYVSQAQPHAPEDAASITMACIDMAHVVVVPEMTVQSTDDHCRVFADRMANGCWQSPSADLTKTILNVIRRSASSPISRQPPEFDAMPNTGMMSVWEWLGRALAANKEALKSIAAKLRELNKGAKTE